MNDKHIFITGVSSGFGRAIAAEALRRGHRVTGTVRNDEAREAFEAQAPGRAQAVLLDIADLDAVAPIIAGVEERSGPIDVLVNNAGYGHEGIFEESPLEEMTRQFRVNVFGTVAVTQAVLPFMRTRRSGQIISITSMGGHITMPGIAWYCGSKFALEGITGVLRKEVAAFGIVVTAVAPGSFRTDWAGRSMGRSPRSIDDYDALFDPIRAARASRSGAQPGDPHKAARAILDLLAHPAPPAHLVLGSDALQLIRQQLADFSAELDAGEAVSRSTDGV
ncbi:short-subunit dehydrogenase [Pseudoduganella lurida]|uniref:Short-subunit dehydrogenase n=1 Tax=Pseudoduganella lurida TaxID=1036180 RepID=A0A562RAV1_9BURK|nr:oxidoreductase [Pseudoduganella lurida]TWI66199.1 short-subunit dehydrogenase [Pseudoduganella lurida]